MRRPYVTPLLALVGLVAGCAVEPEGPTVGPSERPVVWARDRAARPSLARFERASEGGDAEARARAALAALAPAHGVTADDVTRLTFVSAHRVGSAGAVLVAFEDRPHGVAYLDGAPRVLLDAAGRALAVRGTLRPRVARDGARPRLDVASALSRALPGVLLDVAADARGRVRFGRPGEARDGAARLAWFDVEGKPRLVYVIDDVPAGDAHAAARTVLDADDGTRLARLPLVVDEAYTYRVFADATGEPLDGPMGDVTPGPAGAPTAAFPAYVPATARTIEGLPRPVAIVPWLPNGSTALRGGHAEAYVDWTDPDGFDAGDLAVPTTSSRTFDYATNPATDPVFDTSARAGATHAFYVVNRLHDYFYASGFDERAAIAQRTDTVAGGTDDDAMRLEVQDGASEGRKNNANMLALSDGLPPRMQLYLFEDASPPIVAATPGGTLPSSTANFGPETYDVTATAAVALDGVAPTSDACEPLTNAVTGRLVVVTRGNCTFESKALRAQAAGAVGVLIVNDVVGQDAVTMADDASTADPSIPTAGTTRADGLALTTAIGMGAVSLRIARTPGPPRDAALDTAVVAHEWGHYLHLRHASCATTQCRALSEGIADFVALHTLVRDGDDLTGIFPVGVYVGRTWTDAPTYFGLRRVPYSIDPNRNALSFRHIEDDEALPSHPVEAFSTPNSEVHNAGEVWASALWEVYVALANRPGATHDGVRRTVADILVATVRTAPDDATFLEMRDAFVASTEAVDPTLLSTVASAFARRGFGSCASGPARDSEDLKPVVESITVAGALEVDAPTLTPDPGLCDDDTFLDVGETGTASVVVRNVGPGTLTGVAVTLASNAPALQFPTGATVTLPSLAPYAESTVSVPVALQAAASTTARLTASVTAAGGCTAASRTVARTARLDADALPSVALVTSFEAGLSGLLVEGAPRASASADDGNAGLVRIDGTASRETTSLVTPTLTRVPGTSLEIAFRYRSDLETGSTGTPYDGVVVEVSDDGGSTYQDVSRWVAVPYTVQRVPADSDSDLAGRPVISGRNVAYPAMTDVALRLPAALFPDTAKVRFRFASDTGRASGPFELDDLRIGGVSTTPLTAVVADPGCMLAADASGYDAGIAVAVDGGSWGVGVRGVDEGCSCTAAGTPMRGRGAIVWPLLAAWLSARAIRRRGAWAARAR